MSATPPTFESREDPGRVTQVARYVAVGVGANLAVLVLYYGLSIGLRFSPLAALLISSAFGFAFAFVAQRAWTFRSRVPIGPALLRYGAGYAGSLAFQLAFLHAGTRLLGAPHQIVMPLGLATATVLFFLVQRFWVFSRDAGR